MGISAFEALRAEVDSNAAPDAVRSDLWAGLSMAAIAREWGVKPSLIRRCRDELFAPFADPETVKAAANGPLINAHAINRPKAGRKPNPAAKPVQVEMFPA